MPMFDLECPKGHQAIDCLLGSSEPIPSCKKCGQPMKKLPSLVSHTFAQPKGGAARLEWGMKRRKELEKRSADYDKSPRGRNERLETLAKFHKRRGTI